MIGVFVQRLKLHPTTGFTKAAANRGVHLESEAGGTSTITMVDRTSKRGYVIYIGEGKGGITELTVNMCTPMCASLFRRHTLSSAHDHTGCVCTWGLAPAMTLNYTTFVTWGRGRITGVIQCSSPVGM